MRMLCSIKLSPHRYKTPEGYLYCKDAIIARTGKQTYLKSEIFDDCTEDEYIDVDRSAKEVFSEKTMASFEKKPLTIDHPSVSVGPDNYKDLAVGHIENVRKGEFEGQPVMLADIIVNDAEAISLIENGEMVELSCGYDCDITTGDHPEQVNIRGNHVALCEQGRAGIARIQDSKKKPWGIKPIEDSVGKGTLIQEFGKQGKQYKIAKIVGNVIYANCLVDGKLVLFKKDEENIEWATITKSEVRDSKEKSTFWIVNGKEFKEKSEAVEEAKKMLKEDKLKEFSECWTDEMGYEHCTDMRNSLKDTVTFLEVKDEKYNPNKYSDQFTNEELEKFIKEAYGKNVSKRKKKIFVNKEEKEKFLKSLPKELEPMSDEFDHEFEDGRYLVFWEVYYWEEAQKKVEDNYMGVLPKEKRHKYRGWVIIDVGYSSAPYSIEGLSEAKEFRTMDEAKKYIRENLADSKVEDSPLKPIKELDEEIFIEFDAENQKYYLASNYDRYVYEIFSTVEEAEEFYEAHKDDVRHSLIAIPSEEMEDSKDSKYIIALEDPDNNSVWLDEHDRPTTKYELARRFDTYEEADSHRKTYCHGSVQEVKDSKVEDSFDTATSKKEIEELLKDIPHGKIGESWGSLTIDFDSSSEMKKAAKLLIRLYDIELFDEDDDEIYIAVYDKYEKPFKEDPYIIEDSEEKWTGFDLKRGPASKEFKNYLRNMGLYFEPSENGDFVHFEVKNANEWTKQRAEDIREHWAKFNDSYTRKFYIKAIKHLEKKLEELEKEKLLEENNREYVAQKEEMKKEIESQIKEYKEKLENE